MRVLMAPEVAPWVREVLLDPKRQRPVVAVTTQPRSDHTWIDPVELDAAIGDLAEVVRIETGDPTWELAEALPPRLDAYGGAIRVWWPGLNADSNPYDHRLYFAHSPADAARVFEQIVAAVRGGSGATGAAEALEPPAASPWERVVAELAEGEVVLGRVQNVKEYGAFVDLLPQVTGLVHKSEIDWTFVKEVPEFVSVGQVLPVKVLRIDREQRRIDLSIKRALGTDPRPSPALAPGGAPFVWPAGEARRAAEPSEPMDERDQKIRSLTAQLGAAAQELAQLGDELEASAQDRRTLREQSQDLRKQLRAAEDRHVALERRVESEHPFASERAFLRGVRLTYARMFDESDRFEHPLRKMRVGSEFLASMRGLDGVEPDKVLEVCAQVAADMAHELAAREVHQLRAGLRGAPARVRASDGAQAWRCALQVNTPSARRLHWWSIPGAQGPTIEFAKVGLHDDYSIPE